MSEQANKKYKMIADFDDCVVLLNKATDYYIVREKLDGDTLFMSPDKALALEKAENYHLSDMIKIRYEKFTEMLKRIAD